MFGYDQEESEENVMARERTPECFSETEGWKEEEEEMGTDSSSIPHSTQQWLCAKVRRQDAHPVLRCHLAV